MVGAAAGPAFLMHGGLGADGFVAVDVVGKPDDNRRGGSERLRLGGRCRARVSELGGGGANGVKPRQILRRADDYQVERAALDGLAVGFEADAIGRTSQSLVIALELGVGGEGFAHA